MKSISIIFLFVVGFCSSPPSVFGQGNLILISSIDNINSDIRQGCEKDYSMALQNFRAIAADAGMGFQEYLLPFNYAKVEQFMEYFECGPDDAIVFFYAGHGIRYEEDGSEWPWPYLYYCNRQSGNDPLGCEFDMDEIQEMISGKNPRMSLTISVSCNDVVDNSAANNTLAQETVTRPNPPESNTYIGIDLFKTFRGHVIASAASPGKFAETSPSDGSDFARSLFYMLSEDLNNHAPTSWERIFRKTKEQVMQISNGQQCPQYCVNGHCG
jgi:hypothetical protein